MREHVKIAAVMLFAGMLAGCQTTANTTTAVVTVTKPQLVVPPVDMVTLRDVDWRIIVKDARPGQPGSIDEAFRKGNSTSLYAVDAKDYEDLSVNTANLLRTIKQYQAQVRAYQDYYADDKDAGTTPDGNKKTPAPK
jgi:hypothetical protein